MKPQSYPDNADVKKAFAKILQDAHIQHSAQAARSMFAGLRKEAKPKTTHKKK